MLISLNLPVVLSSTRLARSAQLGRRCCCRCESIRCFNRATFLEEGRWLWRGVMLPWVARSWTAALQRVQGLQDAMVRQHDTY